MTSDFYQVIINCQNTVLKMEKRIKIKRRVFSDIACLVNNHSFQLKEYFCGKK